ncbi:MAG TPA: SGNH/GDSL hydrolase family protein, partial [Polyangia bacterium]
MVSACSSPGPAANHAGVDANVDRGNQSAGGNGGRGANTEADSGAARPPTVPTPDAANDASSNRDGTSGGLSDASVDVPGPDSTATRDTMPNAFDPCPPSGTPCRIMPLGDSITHGIGSTSGAGYRVPLFQRALAAKRALTFVGSDQNGPATVDGIPFPPQHEGHRMFIIDTVGTRAGLLPLINEVVTTHRPHIVTLMIGTNDAGSSSYAAEAPRRMGELLDRIFVAAPNALVVVAKIIPTTNDSRNQVVATFNNALPAIVAARAAAGKAILLVDMYQPFVGQADFKTALMADSLHPNEAGFAKMAEVWWNAIQSHLRE